MLNILFKYQCLFLPTEKYVAFFIDSKNHIRMTDNIAETANRTKLLEMRFSTGNGVGKSGGLNLY